METVNEKNQSASEAEQTSSLSLFSLQRNPLLIDTVIRTLFRFVDYASLKECRLVCYTWKEACDPIFVQRSAFVFSKKTNDITETFLESPEDISCLFQSIDLEEILFRAFKFDLPIVTTPVREIYLEPNKRSMVKLEISANSNPPWKGNHINYNIDNLIGPRLNNLRVENSLLDLLFLSLHKLVPVQEINLNKCAIVVNCNLKVAPKVLKLAMCALELSGQVEEITQMNEIIDFTKLTTLCLYYHPRYLDTTTAPILNWSDCANIESLTLICITINLNGKISPKELRLEGNRYKINGFTVLNVMFNDYIHAHGHIKKMEINDRSLKLDYPNLPLIDQIEVEEHITMIKRRIVGNIKRLKLKPAIHIRDPAIIDLAYIPRTIECLELTNSLNNFIICSPGAIFWNLKELYLDGGLDILSHFPNCPSLQTVVLNFPTNMRNKIFSFDILPPSVQTLSLVDVVNFAIEVDKYLSLKLLVFSFNQTGLDDLFCSLKLVSNTIFKYKSKYNILADTVVFNGHVNGGTETKYFKKDDIAKIMEVIENKDYFRFENVVFGPVEWGNETFKCSLLFNVCDRKSEYYCFHGQRGKGISKLEYCKMIPLDGKIISMVSFR